jgi:DNA polymerase III subunit gamma/tau
MSSLLIAQNLAESNRALVFEDIKGEDHITSKVINCLRKNKLNKYLLLLSTVSGCGKTSLSRLIARRLLCKNRKQEDSSDPNWHNPCNVCEHCVNLINDPTSIPAGYIEYDCASESNKSALITSIQNWTRQASLLGYRIILLDEIHGLSRDAQDALLAVLEGLYRSRQSLKILFILATREPSKLKDALVNRGMTYSFNPLGNEAIVTALTGYLETTEIEYEHEALSIIADASSGSMRLAWQTLERMLQEEGRAIDASYAASECCSLTRAQRDLMWRAIASDEVKKISDCFDSWVQSTGSPSTVARALLRDLNSSEVLQDKEKQYAITHLDVAIHNGTPECIKHAVLSLKGIKLQTFTSVRDWLGTS